MTMGSCENEIMVAVAELLAARGVADWDPAGSYPDDIGTPAVFIYDTPETPRPAVTLATYPVASGWWSEDSITGLQVRTRAPGRDPRAVLNLDSSIHDILHGMHGRLLGGYRVTKIRFESGAVLGRDQNDRWERVSNYYLHGPHYKEDDSWPTP